MDLVLLDHARTAIRREQLDVLCAELDRSGGLVLLSGPTGHGKSAVAYYALRRAAAQGLSVSTIESHPREPLDGVNQFVDEEMWTNPGGDAWEKIVHEPSLDMLYVRELLGTAALDLVVTAAGRRRTKFLSTTHTVDAPSTPLRFIASGVDAWRVSAGLRFVQAQRRLRRLCPSCREPVSAPATVFDKVGLEPPASVYRARGCSACGDTGVLGSVVVCEQLAVDDEVAALIAEAAPVSKLGEVARRRGMRGLRVEALECARAGEVTVEEALLET